MPRQACQKPRTEASVARVSCEAWLEPAHLDHRAFVLGAGDRALDEAADRAVLHRHIAGRADQVGLLQPALGHRRIVVLEPDIGPLQFGLVRPFRQYQTQRDRIVDLLQDEIREDAEDLQRDAVADLVDRSRESAGRAARNPGAASGFRSRPGRSRPCRRACPPYRIARVMRRRIRRSRRRRRWSAA